MEAFSHHVDDKSSKVGGKQHIVVSHDAVRYVFPLDIVRGLARLRLLPYTHQELEELPHVIMTSDVDWDQSFLDHL